MLFSPSASKIRIIFYMILYASLIDIIDGESNFEELIDRKRQVGSVYLSQEEMREISKVLRFVNRRRSVKKRKSFINKENMKSNQKLLMELDEVQHVLEKRLASLVVPGESFEKIRNRGRRKRKTKREQLQYKKNFGIAKLPKQAFPLMTGSYDLVSQDNQEGEEKKKTPNVVHEMEENVDNTENWNETDTKSILGKIYTDLTDLKRMNVALCSKEFGQILYSDDFGPKEYACLRYDLLLHTYERRLNSVGKVFLNHSDVFHGPSPFYLKIVHILLKQPDYFVTAKLKELNSRCKLNGTWESEKAGVLFPLKECNEPYDIKLEADYVKRYSRRKILSPNWKCLGMTPFENLPAIILIAVNKCKQQTAVFVGQCKICDGIEVIAGNWLLTEKARDCKHLVAGQQVVGDVMRRNIRLVNFQQLKRTHFNDESGNGSQTKMETEAETFFDK